MLSVSLPRRRGDFNRTGGLWGAILGGGLAILQVRLLHHLFEVVELVVALLAHAAGVGQLVGVFTIFCLFFPPVDVVAMVAHSLRRMLGVCMGASGDPALFASLVLT